MPKPEGSGGGAPKPEGSGGGAPKPEGSGGGAPKPEGSDGGVPKPEGSGGGAPKPEGSGGGVPKPKGSGGGAPKPEGSGGGAPKPEGSGGGAPKAGGGGGGALKARGGGGGGSVAAGGGGIAIENLDELAGVVNSVAVCLLPSPNIVPPDPKANPAPGGIGGGGRDGGTGVEDIDKVFLNPNEVLVLSGSEIFWDETGGSISPETAADGEVEVATGVALDANLGNVKRKPGALVSSEARLPEYPANARYCVPNKTAGVVKESFVFLIIEKINALRDCEGK